MCKIRNVLLTWELTEKNGTGSVKVLRKKNDIFKERVVTPTFYVMKWKWQAYSIRD